MEIKITHNVDDISAQVTADVEKAITRRVDAEMQRLSAVLKTGAETLVNELTQLLEIKDDRQRDRTRRAVVRNLDKWTKGGLK